MTDIKLPEGHAYQPDDDQATGDSSFGTGEGPAGEDDTDEEDQQ